MGVIVWNKMGPQERDRMVWEALDCPGVVILNYTTDMNAAWTVLHRVASLSMWKQEEFLDELTMFHLIILSDIAHWTAEDICKAFLKTMGYEVVEDD